MGVSARLVVLNNRPTQAKPKSPHGQVHLRKPDWLKIQAPGGEGYKAVKARAKASHAATVCEEAGCPNLGECWGQGTATFMLMGDTCTRACRFCLVNTAARPAPLNPSEPEEVAKAIQAMGLRYAVLTSVDRDDLPDAGADHIAQTVLAIKTLNPEVLVELLAPDFSGRVDALSRVIEAPLAVFAHNVEVVRRLTPALRDRRASYDQSLFVLDKVKELAPSLLTKSSVMLGLGETEAELRETLEDLRMAGVDILTLGQYLRPSKKHYPVAEYVSPARFQAYGEMARRLGFAYVASGPLVRSSYKAGELFVERRLAQ